MGGYQDDWEDAICLSCLCRHITGHTLLLYSTSTKIYSTPQFTRYTLYFKVRAYQQCHVITIVHIFIVDYSSAALRHAMANTIAVVLALPEECNHLWYHMFRPDCLRNTFVTGFMVCCDIACNLFFNMIHQSQINARISEVWHYDCGIELTSDGDYGRRYYNERISLHSQYLLLFVNFAAFCISLYTQENATVQISGPVLSPSLAVRHYCLGQLKTIWSHIQTNLGLTLEEASHLIMRTVLKFLQVSVSESYTLSLAVLCIVAIAITILINNVGEKIVTLQ